MFTPCIIIPVYNHEEAITPTVKALQQYDVPCILVNDGSNEKCTQVLEDLDKTYSWVSLIQHTENQGKGAAVKTGLHAAQQASYTHAIQIDADGQHDSNDIPLFLSMAQLHPTAIISGLPIYDDSVPKHRLYARYITHVWVWINTLSLSIKDSMCGFRVYPVKITTDLLQKENTPNRMAFDTDILVRSYWHGTPTLHLPTKVHYPLDGISHFQGFKDNVLISKMHARLFFGMLMRLPKILYNKLFK
jgi:glycosyltransferase involved in cell wall biosynthesis